MDFATFKKTVYAFIPIDTGNMFRRGVVFFDTPYYFRAHYDVNSVPYIVYNEEGTIYTQKNKGFIRNKTVGAINQILWAEGLGLEIDVSSINETYASKANQILELQGVMTNVG